MAGSAIPRRPSSHWGRPVSLVLWSTWPPGWPRFPGSRLSRSAGHARRARLLRVLTRISACTTGPGSTRPTSPLWPGRAFAPGQWGPIVNGGAWLTIGGTKVDLIYRDLDEVLYWTAAAGDGWFEIHRA